MSDTYRGEHCRHMFLFQRKQLQLDLGPPRSSSHDKYSSSSVNPFCMTLSSYRQAWISRRVVRKNECRKNVTSAKNVSSCCSCPSNRFLIHFLSMSVLSAQTGSSPLEFNSKPAISELDFLYLFSNLSCSCTLTKPSIRCADCYVAGFLCSMPASALQIDLIKSRNL